MTPLLTGPESPLGLPYNHTQYFIYVKFMLYSTGPLIGPPNHQGSLVMGPRYPSHQVHATLRALDKMP